MHGLRMSETRAIDILIRRTGYVRGERDAQVSWRVHVLHVLMMLIVLLRRAQPAFA